MQGPPLGQISGGAPPKAGNVCGMVGVKSGAGELSAWTSNLVAYILPPASEISSSHQYY